MDIKFFLGTDFDPWRNLAVEEYLLQNVRSEECILYLWQNQNTVVIGKNQNAWRECQTKLLEEENGKLARRLSGGGAVFHDLGNLNFTFVVDRALYDLEKQLQVILTAVQKMGIQAVFSGRNDLVVEDRKFSGNAFYLRNDRAFHHGTILVDANMQKLSRYLQVSKEKMDAKGVKSVVARVANLTEYVSDITIDKTKNALMESFQEVYDSHLQQIDRSDIPDEAIDSLYEKYSSWQWCYGESPVFDISLNTRFGWGGVELGLHLKHGKITKAVIYSDAMDEEFVAKLPQVLEETTFHSQEIASKLENISTQNELQKTMIKDITNWLSEKGF